MELKHETIDGMTRVTLTGRLDTAGVGQVELPFTAFVVPAAKPTLIDLSATSFLASLGVRLLITSARALTAKGGKMVLFGATPAVMEIIETTCLDDIIPVAATEAEAIALLKA